LNKKLALTIARLVSLEEGVSLHIALNMVRNKHPSVEEYVVKFLSNGNDDEIRSWYRRERKQKQVEKEFYLRLKSKIAKRQAKNRIRSALNR
jgi:hypothetical protein